MTNVSAWLQVWRFIMDREVEAPERFQAIQTYRATMAVLKQQLAFITTMYDSGIIDDMERDELLRFEDVLEIPKSSDLQLTF